MTCPKVENDTDKKCAPKLDVSREEALRGLKDEKGRPLGKEHIASAESAQNDRALAEEFIRFLGSPAVQKALDERGKTNDVKNDAKGRHDCDGDKHGEAGQADKVEGNLRSLLRGLLDLVSGKKEAPAGKAGDGDDGNVKGPQDKKKAAGTPPAKVEPKTGLPEKAGPGSALSSSAPAAIRKFEEAVEHASRVTGLEANLIAAMIWAESRGNPNVKTRNIDGHSDVGLMQISQHTYDAYVRGQNRGLPALNVNDPAQNILAGALEMAQKLKDKRGDLRGALNAYVGEGLNNKYVPNVMHFYNEMRNGRTPSDTDYV